MFGFNRNGKTSNVFLKVLIAVLSILLILVCLLIIFYKLNINVALKHVDEYDYTVGDIVDSPKYSLEDLIKYDENVSENVIITLPKQLVYNEFIKIEDINSNLIEKYKVNINRIGFISDENNPETIIVSLDCSYLGKLKIDFYAQMLVRYGITEDNCFEIVYEDLTIGENVPRKLYEKYIPYAKDEVLLRFDSNNSELLKNGTIKLNNIYSLKANKENVELEADLQKTIEDFIENNFNIVEEVGGGIKEVIDNLKPIVMDVLFDIKEFFHRKK